MARHSRRCLRVGIVVCGAACCALHVDMATSRAQAPPPASTPFVPNQLPPGTVVPGTPVPSGYQDPRFNNYGPVTPAAPMTPTRPESWPGGPQDPGMQGQPVPIATPPLVEQTPIRLKSPAEPPYDPATILAIIGGTELVQASEVLPGVRQRIEDMIAENTEEFARMAPDEQRQLLMNLERNMVRQSVLENVVYRLLMVDLKAKASPEGLKKNQEFMRKDFNDKQVKQLMKQYHAASEIDLDNRLRRFGGSLESQRRWYCDIVLAGGWVNQQIKDDAEPTHDQMLRYYHEHAKEWDVAARVRWERLTIKFMNFDSKREAKDAIVRHGNAIFSGAPFADVARAQSQDFSASDGGLYDWTSQGSLKSEAIDQHLFALPVGALSPIIEDEEGFHIVRVIERQDARRIGFAEVQDEIKASLSTKSKDQKRNEYVENLRKRTSVWTVFDEPEATAQNTGGTMR